MSIAERLFVVEEISHSDSSGEWKPVDITVITKEGVYLVFNTFTGQHHRCETLVAAKEKYAELVARITAQIEITMPSSFEPDNIALLRNKLNGFTVTWVSGNTTRVYGSVS